MDHPEFANLLIAKATTLSAMLKAEMSVIQTSTGTCEWNDLSLTCYYELIDVNDIINKIIKFESLKELLCPKN